MVQNLIRHHSVWPFSSPLQAGGPSRPLIRLGDPPACLTYPTGRAPISEPAPPHLGAFGESALPTELPFVQALCTQDLFIGGRKPVEYRETPTPLETLPTTHQERRIGPGFQACLSVQFSHLI